MTINDMLDTEPDIPERFDNFGHFDTDKNGLNLIGNALGLVDCH